MLVLVGHFSYSAGAPIRNSWWTDSYAHYGVRIFFIISGFLITTLLQRERQETGGINLKQFYIRRAYRILPVAYIYMFVTAAIYYGTFSTRQLALAFTYLSSYAVDLPWALSHLWSLSVEEQFYVVWPLVAGFSLALSRRLALLAILVGPVFRLLLEKHGMHAGALWYFPSVADSLASGCLLALCQHRLLHLRSFFGWRGFPLIWAATLSIPLVAHSLSASTIAVLWPLPQILGHSAVTFFNLGIVVCIQSSIMAPPRILNSAILVWIGTLSYSLYLWQMLFSNPQGKSWATTFPLNVALAFLTAIVSFYGIERPFLRLRELRAEPTPLRTVRAPGLQAHPSSE